MRKTSRRWPQFISITLLRGTYLEDRIDSHFMEGYTSIQYYSVPGRSLYLGDIFLSTPLPGGAHHGLAGTKSGMAYMKLHPQNAEIGRSGLRNA